MIQNNLNVILFKTIEQFVEIEKSPEEVQKYFNKISNILLNETILKIKDRNFRIAEIEFYYNDIEQHHDPFTHNDPIQYNQNYWYFHKKGGVYRGGTWKGVDITFGQYSPIKFSGGILIRSIREINKNSEMGEYIHGPSKVVDKILEIFKRTSVKELMEEEFNNNADITQNTEFTLCSTIKEEENIKTNNLNNSNQNQKLNKSSVKENYNKRKINKENKKIESDNIKNKKLKVSYTKSLDIHTDYNYNIKLKKEEIFKMPRVGLAPHPENKQEDLDREFYYLLKNYRYIIYPELVKKGKVQLIIGLYLNKFNLDKIQHITGSKSILVEKYISDFKKGEKTKLKQLNLKKIDDLCKLFGFISYHSKTIKINN